MFSNNLKLIREKSGLTKAELARKLNIPYTTYDSYERGSSEPKIETIKKIADALHVAVYDLIQDEMPLEERTDSLIKTYEHSVEFWIKDKPFTKEERQQLAEHYVDLLLRYKKIVEQFSAAKYSDEMAQAASAPPEICERLKSSYFREFAQQQLDDLKQWVDAMPDYISRTKKSSE